MDANKESGRWDSGSVVALNLFLSFLPDSYKERLIAGAVFFMTLIGGYLLLPLKLWFIFGPVSIAVFAVVVHIFNDYRRRKAYDHILSLTEQSFSQSKSLSGVVTGEFITKQHQTAYANLNFEEVATSNVVSSYNVSSVADNGIGDYLITWGRPFKDANYRLVVSVPSGKAEYQLTKDSARITIKSDSGIPLDPPSLIIGAIQEED